MGKNIFGMDVGNSKEVIDKVKKPSPFDFAKAICTKNKEDIEKVNKFIDTSSYSQYMLINILMQTINRKEPNGKWKNSEMWRFVKELNIMNITNRMQFDMLMNLVPPNPGFLKYHYKTFKDTDKDRIALRWKFSSDKNETIDRYLGIISDDELEEIHEEKKKWDKLYKVKKEKKK